MKRALAAIALLLALTGCSGPQEPSGTEIPSVVGMAGDEAQDALRDAGFKVEWDAGEDSVWMASNWTVDGQDPAAGGHAEDGATITLAVSKPGAAEPTAAAPAPAANTDGLGARVEAELKTQWGVANFSDGLTRDYDTDMLNWYIASISDVSSGVIEIVVQVTADQTTEEEAKRLSIVVLNLVGTTFPELQWVMVQTADGAITQQSQRSEAPILNQ